MLLQARAWLYRAAAASLAELTAARAARVLEFRGIKIKGKLII